MKKKLSILRLSFNNLMLTEEDRKRFIVVFFSFTGFFSLIFFLIIAVVNKKYNIVYINTAFAFVTLSNLIYFLIKGKVGFSSNVLVSLMFLLELFLFISIGDSTTGVFWYYIFIPLSILTLNNRVGTFYSVLLIVFTLCIFMLDFGDVQEKYSSAFMLRFFFTYSIVGVLINVFEFSRKSILNRYESILDEQELFLNKLQTKNDKLLAVEEELKQQNEELKVLYENNEYQVKVIKQNEIRLDYILNAIGEGLGITDFNENFIYANPRADSIFGLKPGGLLGRNLKDFIDDKEWTKIVIQTQRRREKQVSTYDLKLALPDGAVKNIIVTAVPDLEIEGNVSATIGVFRDISDRVLREKQILELKNQLEILLNNLPASVYYKDVNLKYILVNQAYADLFGVNKQELIGKTDDEITSEEVALEHKYLDLNVLEEKEPIINYENVSFTKHKEQYWTLTSKIPYFDNQGNLKGIVGIISDITKRKLQQIKILEQKSLLESANQDIKDSLNYAKSIQDALLPNHLVADKYFKEHFIFYRPKENVSGDFYYINKIQEKVIFAVGDCTGHGIPGAFLTMLSITFLHELITNGIYYNPGDLLNQLRIKFKDMFSFSGEVNKNGMDISICFYYPENKILQFAGAYQAIFLIRNNELIKYKATPNPIGHFIAEIPFKSQDIQIMENDALYLMSDGYQDQFGGDFFSKYTTKRFRNILVDINNKSMCEQKDLLIEELDKWQGDEEQIDDITIMGIRF
ncbi:MAG: PAS domain S-box protein [Bacteroidales bacterium]|nr:PAS domain S-box protein [Bacteroidales bacterium]